jgi:hypothetical protein
MNNNNTHNKNDNNSVIHNNQYIIPLQLDQAPISFSYNSAHNVVCIVLKTGNILVYNLGD